jgi:hypothetical protein
MVLSNHISTTVVKFGIILMVVEASLTDYKNFTTNVLEKLHNKCARIIMNFKDEPGQSQRPWSIRVGKFGRKAKTYYFLPGSCLRLSKFGTVRRGSHHCSRILTISTVIIYEVQVRLSFCHDRIPSMAENVSDIVGLRSGIAFLNK